MQAFFEVPRCSKTRAILSRNIGMVGEVQTEDYNLLEDINSIINEPILSHEVIVPCLSHLEKYKEELNCELDKAKNELETEGKDAISNEDIKEKLKELIEMIECMQLRAFQVERLVTKITVDIKQLDYAKKNITYSMIVLKRLQMLTVAYEQLKMLIKTKQYEEITHLLQAILQLTSYFKSFRSVDQIAALCNNISELKTNLFEQACLDFENIFISPMDMNKKAFQLLNICNMLDILENNARERILLWYCNTQLREYRTVFRGNDEAASLDNISRRYAWLKRMLNLYDEKHAKMFPKSWNADERLCQNFCANTSEDIQEVLSRSEKNIKISILLEALQKTLEFEHYLEKRFNSNYYNVTNTFISKQESKTITFHKSIKNTFNSYLYIFIQFHENALSNMIQSFKKLNMENEIKNNPQLMVTSSSTELFLFYRQTLAQYEKLSNEHLLIDFSYLFARWLIIYAETILLPAMDGKQATNINICCLILNTSDYCYKTTMQLEKLIKGKVSDNFREKIGFDKEKEMFLNIAGISIKNLVKIIETSLSGSFKDMMKIDWSQLKNIVDQSAYVTSMTSVLKNMSEKIMEKISIEKFIRIFCDKMVESFLDNFMFYITRCRPISEVGAEQMILDLYSIKMALLKLPIITNEKNTQAHISYTKFVNKEVSKIETILKVLLTQINSSEEFVKNYLVLIGDKNISNFLKILELKGLRKQEQNQLLEIFNIQTSQHSDLIDSSSLLEPLILSPQSGANISLPYCFDTSNINTSIFSAARDNSERLHRNSISINSESLSSSRLNERFKGLFRRDSFLGAGYSK
ncbi:hypothetical protein T552_01237 [Pneumocystis carinii B80]|uniref:Uncharacterized protein n=1 Tax=Pneumocystis carinii (strain B80) TaxID=1408658 RepID=A0A0W4ZLP1_PNEC8|nr:hypothetical protein T552_01237 [Pneumocystis carinii B80]KTW29282.1 hypothetical protein T552_01237 [Pneumocystis carinii B80]